MNDSINFSLLDLKYKDLHVIIIIIIKKKKIFLIDLLNQVLNIS